MTKMKVLMFGWEYPPYNSGGLGNACQDLCEALAEKNVDITFVLPWRMNVESGPVKFIFPDGSISLKEYKPFLSGYITPKKYTEGTRNIAELLEKEKDLFGKVNLLAACARKVAMENTFDIIHCHDWLTFKAGIEAKNISGKPVVLHVHSTELDRCGFSGVNPQVYNLEKEMFGKADSIVAVSGYTKNVITEHYGVNPDKISVVHNGINLSRYQARDEISQTIRGLKAGGYKVVLYLGRFSLHKGPDYFLEAARRVVELRKDTFFVMAGSGEMQEEIIERTAEYGISDRVLFAGFVRGDDLKALYKDADLYILPSVSEPFGLTVLEALVNETPVIISKQAGVNETINHALKVDFWDIDEMVNKIMAVLEMDALTSTLQENGLREAKGVSWKKAADKCVSLYKKLMNI